MTFGRRNIEQRLKDRAAQRAANMAALCTPSRAIARGSYGGTTAGPAPKSEPYRDPALLEMARGRPCLLNDPVICDHSRQPEDTVSAHSNWSEHGKACARKADDCYSAHLCFAAHAWLDQGKAPESVKRHKFMCAHANTVLFWHFVSMDSREPERFRNAARRALQHLNATPITEAP